MHAQFRSQRDRVLTDILFLSAHDDPPLMNLDDAVRFSRDANAGDFGQRALTDRVGLALRLAGQEVVCLGLWHGQNPVPGNVGAVLDNGDHTRVKRVLVLVHVG